MVECEIEISDTEFLESTVLRFVSKTTHLLRCVSILAIFHKHFYPLIFIVWKILHLQGSMVCSNLDNFRDLRVVYFHTYKNVIKTVQV